MGVPVSTRNRTRKVLYKQLAGTDAASIERRNQQIDAMMAGNSAILEEMTKLDEEDQKELKLASRELKELKRLDQKEAAKSAGKTAVKNLKTELKGRKDLTQAQKDALVAAERRKARHEARADVRAKLHAQLIRPGGVESKNKKKFKGEGGGRKVNEARGQHMYPCGNIACRRCYPAPEGVKDTRRWKRVHRYGYAVFGPVPQ